MARGKKTIEFDQALLTQILNTLEEEQTFSNLNILYEAALKKYCFAGGLNSTRLTTALINLRVQKWQLTLKTKPGKRGRKASGDGTTKVVTVTRKIPVDKDLLAPLRAEIKKNGYSTKTERESVKHWKNVKLVDGIAAGSIKAAVKLNCLQCMNFDKAEVRSCDNNTCAFWAIRPYKKELIQLNTEHP